MIQFGSLLPLSISSSSLLLTVLATGFGWMILASRRVQKNSLLTIGLLRFVAVILFALILWPPTIHRTQQQPQRTSLLVLIDHSPSMSQPADSQRKTRQEQVRNWLTRGELAEHLREKFGQEVYSFAETAIPDRLDSPPVLAEAADTRLAESLAAACEHQTALGNVVDRVLIVSDGLDHSQLDAAQLAAKHGLRIDTLAPTSLASAPIAHWEIADVQGIERVLLGSETMFRVVVRRETTTAAENTIVTLSLQDRIITEQTVPFAVGEREQTTLVRYRPELAGPQELAFQLTAADQSPPAKLFPLQVLDQSYEILILEETWRWEYKFLARLVEDDPSYRFTALLARGGGAFAQFASPDRRVNLIGFPENAADLQAFDLFILGDVQPQRWPAGLAAKVAHLVANEGRSLVIVGSPGLKALSESAELYPLLPVDLGRESGTPIEGKINLRIPTEASRSPFAFQLPVGEANTLPPLERIYPVLRKRPAATVLLEAAGQRNSYGNLIVAAEHTVGRGRVLFVATDTLWKWHTLAPATNGPTPYTTFWQQALRALSPERVAADPVQLWLTPQRSEGEVGQQLSVAAEVNSQRVLKQLSLRGEWTSPTGERTAVYWQPTDESRGTFSTNLVPQSAGLHTLEVQLLAEGQPVANVRRMLSVRSQTDETTPQPVNREYLARLASATGGRLLDLADRSSWPQPTAAEPTHVTRTSATSLWQTGILLVLLAITLGCDWGYRVWRGLI